MNGAISSPLLAIAMSDAGVLDPHVVRAHQRPVALFRGGIHAGEIDGKDAGFIALRGMLALLNAWGPILYTDMHVTHGSVAA